MERVKENGPGRIAGAEEPGMFGRLLLAVVLAFGASTLDRGTAGYLDENPDYLFSDVYARLGLALPQRIARDPYVWLRLEELKREPCDQPAQQPEVQSRRLADAVLSERDAGQGQGSELAAGTEGRFHRDASHVLAEGKGPFDPQWHLATPAGDARVVAPG